MIELQSKELDDIQKRMTSMQEELRASRGGQGPQPSPGARPVERMPSLSPQPHHQGRRLTAASARSKWHEGSLHTFEDPSSAGCDLDAELDSAASGALTMRRTAAGNIDMTYAD